MTHELAPKDENVIGSHWVYVIKDNKKEASNLRRVLSLEVFSFFFLAAIILKLFLQRLVCRQLEHQCS